MLRSLSSRASCFGLRSCSHALSSSPPIQRRSVAHQSTTHRAIPVAPGFKKPRMTVSADLSAMKVAKKHTIRNVYEYASKPLTPVSLKHLLDFGRSFNEQMFMQSTLWIRDQLPGRIARQVVALERLPYGLCLMPSVQRIRQWYITSFNELTDPPEPRTYEEAVEYAAVCEKVYERHGGTFYTMARAMYELKQQLNQSYGGAADDGEEHLDIFMQFDDLHVCLDLFYTARIGIRMLLGQHVALLRNFERGGVEDHVGMIAQNCSPAEIAQDAIDASVSLCRSSYGFAPEVIIKGEERLTFPYVEQHLFYMLLELLKNSLRATCDAHEEDELPPVHVIIAHSEENEDVAIKVSDQGGGISRSHMDQIFSYLYTTANIDYDLEEPPDFGASAPLAGLGYGLPISKQYALYFGGDLQVMSMEGYGTDAYLHLRRLGDATEPLPEGVSISLD